MAIVFDPDNLTLGTDILVDTAAKTIRIVTGTAVDDAGSTGGVTGQCLYSFLKARWKDNATFIRFPFPMEAITPEQFEFINGWKPFDDATRALIRTAGWAERAANGTVNRRYMGVVSLGSIGSSDQPYYNWNGGSRVNFSYPGQVNQAVQIFGDASNGNFDFTSGNFTIYVREQGKTYASSTNAQIGAATLSYITYRFPLSNAVDLNVVASDATIAADAPYTNISVQFYATNQDRNIDGTNAPFRIIVTDSSGIATTRQIYEKIQYLLRQNSDIDSGAGTVIGATANALLSFVGQTLVGTTSLAIDNLNSNFLNSVEFFDQNGVRRVYPFVAAGTINFGSNAGSGDFKYWVFFADTPDGDFGAADAIIVNDASGNPIAGTFAGSPVTFTFAYDTNAQGGRTPAVDAPVKVVGIGLTGGQYISVDYTITRTSGQSILLAPALERNYQNP